MTSSITLNERNVYVKHSEHTKFKSPQDEIEHNKTTFKTCRVCKNRYDLNQFANNTSGKDPFDKDGFRLKRPECRNCTRNKGKGKREAIMKAKLNDILEKPPKGTICFAPECNEPATCFDHDPLSNSFRGYLCGSHNKGLGFHGDSPTGLMNALLYTLGLAPHQKTIQPSLVYLCEGERIELLRKLEKVKLLLDNIENT